MKAAASMCSLGLFWGLVLSNLFMFTRGVQGVKLTFFPGSHLAPKYFKVVANSKKLVAMTHTQNHFYPVIARDRLNC